MRLTQFKVTNFRSVRDSGWIKADDVTALIGANESGKTNLLMPLWKLNPAREGDIAPTSDYPKSMFGDIRANPGDFCFVEAEFATGDKVAALARAAGIPAAEADLVRVRRYYDGAYEVDFPGHERRVAIPKDEVADEVGRAASEIEALTALKTEEAAKAALLASLRDAARLEVADGMLGAAEVRRMASAIAALLPEAPAKTSAIYPRTQQLADRLSGLAEELAAPDPGDDADVVKRVVTAMPKFVYYSNYGNLDSEIFLPHVVQNLAREDLGSKEAAKARTLRVLFRFVTLEPQEILELGRDVEANGRQATQDQIEAVADRKRERSILLQSAGTKLTSKFKGWWKQGDYRFRFDADGNHFRIWVSDDRRPDEIELESRSTGLQWFLSFYLVFLVESEGEHSDAILLLDEPGLSLHPLAQRDLSAFFDSLSATNQLLYTTHSPFLVHADRLERTRRVYVGEDGTTQATEDLRRGSDPRQAGAAYAVYLALNMSVAESLLLGCHPVIVEGPSDQHYLTAIKSLLIGAGKIAPTRELVFPPSGGTKNVRQIASILSGRDETLPFVLLDGDEAGRRLAKELGTSLYADARDRIVTMDDVVGFPGAEIEDLFPVELVAGAVDRLERRPDVAFSDVVKTGTPIVDQVEAWGKSAGVALEPGWKVELSKRVKQQALANGIARFDAATVGMWVTMFTMFTRFADASGIR